MNHHFTTPEPNCELVIEVLGPSTDFATVRSWLPSGRAEGWVMFPDRVELFDPAHPPADRFLSAEIATGQPTSLHIRFDGRAWSGWRYVARPGQVHFTDHRSYASVEGAHIDVGGRRLKYQRVWRKVVDPQDADAIGVWTPWVTRFTGFANSEENV
jgi:hypothetical protein